MKIAILKEHRPFEKRVAATPETVRKLKAQGLDVVIEKDAGLESSYLDTAYGEAGAVIAPDGKTTLADADIVLKVQRPMLPSDGMNELEFERYTKSLHNYFVAVLAPFGIACDWEFEREKPGQGYSECRFRFVIGKFSPASEKKKVGLSLCSLRVPTTKISQDHFKRATSLDVLKQFFLETEKGIT